MNLSPEQLKRYESIYLLYLDETGHSTFSNRKAYTDAKERFLTISGVFVRGDVYWTFLVPKINELKRKYFGNTDVILHYTELFYGRGPNSLQEEQQPRFWNDFLATIEKMDVSLVSITVDKQRLQETYTRWIWDPYHLIIAWHIERVVFALSRIERKGKIVEVGAHPLQARLVIEARGGREDPKTGKESGPDRRLAASYRRVFNEGSKIFQTIKAKDVQKRLTSHEISIADKRANKIGLQVADLVCFPFHWNALFELCPDDLFAMKGKIEKVANVRIFWEKLQCKIAADEQGTIKGFGIKLFPSREELL